MAKTLKSIFISYIIILLSIIMRCACDPFVANASSIDGFTTDLIDRDSPNSPLYDPSLTDSQRLANAKRRSLARARRLNDGGKATAESTISDGQGSYLMQFFLGTPIKRVIAVVDTGSDVTWTQCSPCRKCVRQRYPIFDPRKSRSYRLVKCGSGGCASLAPSSECDARREKCLYSVHYADGSYSLGSVSSETFAFASSARGLLSFRNVVFGCGRENRFNVNDGGGSGIVGLGGGDASLVTQLGYDKFSYCLIPTGPRGNNKTSKLHFGADAAVSGGGVVRTPLSERNVPVFYYLTLEAISVGNKRLEFHSPLLVQGGNIVIDTGSLTTVLPVNFYDQLEVAIANSIEQRAVRDLEDWRLCYTSAFVMPKIVVHFKGADVEWKQENAFIRVNLDYVCLAVDPMDGVRPIYGNVAQANYLVGFDLTKRTVSFKPTDCARYS